MTFRPVSTYRVANGEPVLVLVRTSLRPAVIRPPLISSHPIYNPIYLSAHLTHHDGSTPRSQNHSKLTFYNNNRSIKSNHYFFLPFIPYTLSLSSSSNHHHLLKSNIKNNLKKHCKKGREQEELEMLESTTIYIVLFFIVSSVLGHQLLRRVIRTPAQYERLD
ncbi:uncharacterized protein K460DRAFT_41381 [Cucurbitaria berberidis CBS 394.84]|uniref:Uncharacterized protein n=1 Tax=Cucurbitaria berberidis CBS 394.84 TaxID=1168544 RepID=A0A9P4GUK0_9PLEO|nr:uncharacterized protein K460DRAFT_41381 [Cucurbitaria berberidis CBS 394.84]KAF1851789.1 hypothetical protein K460DRAFT_41381 [Cucurbitaria berberidis CBS 394.84]